MTISMKKTNQGIKYFENRRDKYLNQSKQENISDTLVAHFKKQASDMQDCIERITISKTKALSLFN